MHFRKLYDERFLGSWDLEGRDSAVVEIKEVKLEELRSQDGTTAKKPVLFFTRGKKGMVLNKTNAKEIAALFGNDTDGWVGKKIELFATKITAFGKEMDAIRVSNRRPE